MQNIYSAKTISYKTITLGHKVNEQSEELSVIHIFCKFFTIIILKQW